jgi:hypothetical protein
MKKVSRESRRNEIFVYIMENPNESEGEIARGVGLERTPYSRSLLLELWAMLHAPGMTAVSLELLSTTSSKPMRCHYDNNLACFTDHPGMAMGYGFSLEST